MAHVAVREELAAEDPDSGAAAVVVRVVPAATVVDAGTCR
jgi:hypothetical protein